MTTLPYPIRKTVGTQKALLLSSNRQPSSPLFFYSKFQRQLLFVLIYKFNVVLSDVTWITVTRVLPELRIHQKKYHHFTWSSAVYMIFLASDLGHGLIIFKCTEFIFVSLTIDCSKSWRNCVNSENNKFLITWTDLLCMFNTEKMIKI